MVNLARTAGEFRDSPDRSGMGGYIPQHSRGLNGEFPSVVPDSASGMELIGEPRHRDSRRDGT